MTSRTTEQQRIIPWRALGLGTLLTIVATIVGSVLIRAVFVGIFDISDDFEPLGSAATVVVPSIAYLLIAAVVFAIVLRLTVRPIRVYQIATVIALALSTIPVIGLAISDDNASAAAIVALLLMHVAGWIAVMFILIPFVGRQLREDN